MEKLGPDDDWNEEHIPQAIELHMVVMPNYEHIFKLFNIPLHYKVQGATCMKQVVEEYFLLFDKEDEQGMTFKKSLKHTNYECDLTYTQKEEKKQTATDCHICGMTFDDEFWDNADDKEETYEVEPRQKDMDYKEFKQTYTKQVSEEVFKEAAGETLLVMREKFKGKLSKMYKEYKKTGVPPLIIKKIPPKRSPLYKKINRQKVIDHNHLIATITM